MHFTENLFKQKSYGMRVSDTATVGLRLGLGLGHRKEFFKNRRPIRPNSAVSLCDSKSHTYVAIFVRKKQCREGHNERTKVRKRRYNTMCDHSFCDHANTLTTLIIIEFSLSELKTWDKERP